MKKAIFLICLLLVAACGVKKKKPAVTISAEFQAGKKLGELTNKKLNEVSGLACSINNPGLFWTQADSGNDAEVFLIDNETKIKQVYELAGVDNRDWEDIAVGPGPDSTKNYVYVADIGDNLAAFKHKRIYRFEEPTFTSDDGKVTVTEFDTITFELPDSKKDTEAILLDPASKDIYIITKRENPVTVYKLTYPYADEKLTAQIVTTLPLTYIVAASASSDGKEILMKSYNHIYYWKNDAGKPFAAVFNDSPEEVPYEVEPQGESIAWAPDKSGFYTLSEKAKGKKTFLYFYARK